MDNEQKMTAEQIVRDLAAYSKKYPPGKWYSEGHESHGIAIEIEQRAKAWVDAAAMEVNVFVGTLPDEDEKEWEKCFEEMVAASTPSAGVDGKIMDEWEFFDKVMVARLSFSKGFSPDPYAGRWAKEYAEYRLASLPSGSKGEDIELRHKLDTMTAIAKDLHKDISQPKGDVKQKEETKWRECLGKTELYGLMSDYSKIDGLSVPPLLKNWVVGFLDWFFKLPPINQPSPDQEQPE